MSEFVHLVGGDEVRQAGYRMERAATEIGHFVAQLSDALVRHERFLNEWLDRLESVLRTGREAQ